MNPNQQALDMHASTAPPGCNWLKNITSSVNHGKIFTTKMKSLGKGCGKLKHIQYQKSYYLTDKIKQEETDHRFICDLVQFLIIKYNE